MSEEIKGGLLPAAGSDSVQPRRHFPSLQRWLSILVAIGIRAAAIFFTVAFAGTAAMGRWVGFPIGRELKGIQFSFLGYTPGHTPITPLSFGAVAAVLILIAGCAFLFKRERMLRWTGFLLVALVFFAFLKIAFLDGALLTALADETNQWHNANIFSHKDLPTNLTTEPTFIGNLPTITTLNRMHDGWYYLSIAWYSSTLCALIVFLRARNGLASPRDRSLFVKRTVCVLALCGIASAVPTLIGHAALERAQEVEAKGDLPEARKLYRAALLDNWYALQPEGYARIGEIDAALGRTDTAEYRMYGIEYLITQNDLPSAILEYRKLADMDSPMSSYYRQWTGALWTVYGSQLYHDGATGAAVEAWENARAAEPRQWLAGYCLGRGYFELENYQKAVDVIQAQLATLGDANLRADLYSNLGDCYTRLGEFKEAHLAYRNSYRLADIVNWRGIASTVGGF